MSEIDNNYSLFSQNNFGVQPQKDTRKLPRGSDTLTGVNTNTIEDSVFPGNNSEITNPQTNEREQTFGNYSQMIYNAADGITNYNQVGNLGNDPITGLPLTGDTQISNKMSIDDDDTIKYPDGSNKFVMNSRNLSQYALPERFKDPNQLKPVVVDFAAGRKAKFVQNLKEITDPEQTSIIAVDLGITEDLKKNDPDSYLIEDIRYTSLDSSSVDTIVSNFGPLTFDDYPEANKIEILNEMNRVLKPGGQVVISPIESENIEKYKSLAEKQGFSAETETVENCQDPSFVDTETKPIALVLTKPYAN